jgi:hypothetical protein
MLDRLYDIADRLREINRYALSFGLFVLWTCTFAEVDVMRMIETRLERHHIESRIADTQQDILGLDLQLAEITDRPAAKERHAREEYYMHKPNEDVYIFR